MENQNRIAKTFDSISIIEIELKSNQIINYQNITNIALISGKINSAVMMIE
jgi:hypothetical protein